jgi:hypothetical protein
MGKRHCWSYALPLVALLACSRTAIPGGEVPFEEQPDASDAATYEAGGADVALDSVDMDRELPDASDASDALPDSTPDAPPVLPPPRLLSPLSTATVTSQTPLLRWSLPTGEDGAAVDICEDRACTTLVTSFQVHGSSAMPPVALSPGVYFWRARGTAGGMLGTSFSKVWEFFVGARSAPQNLSWGTVPDVNGDGFADLLTTAPNETNKPGYLFVYLGGAQGLSTSPSAYSLGNEVSAFTNDPVASAGDVNGDGFADVVAAAPHVYGASSGFFLFPGGPNGLGPPTVVAPPPGVGGQFGWEVSSAGDVDGDGYADFLVCSSGGGSVAGCFLYHGGEGAVSAVPWATLSTVPLPPGYTGYLGGSVASAGDINGDGYGDLVFGTSYLQKYVVVYLGSAAGLSPTPAFLYAPHIPNEIDQDPAFGSSLSCAGDVNGDGFADVIIGANGDGDNYNHPGSSYLYLGSATGLSAPLTLNRPTPQMGVGFGATVSGAGDVDGDGYADLLVTTEFQAYFFFGGPAGPSMTALALSGGQANFPSQGTGAGGGDMNGDGFADVVVGAPDDNGYLGSVFVFPGSPSGPTGPLTLTAPAGAGFFGASVF